MTDGSAVQYSDEGKVLGSINTQNIQPQDLDGDIPVLVVELSNPVLVFEKDSTVNIAGLMGNLLNDVKAQVSLSTKNSMIWKTMPEEDRLWYRDFESFRAGVRITQEEYTWKSNSSIMAKYPTFEDWKNAGCPTQVKRKYNRKAAPSEV